MCDLYVFLQAKKTNEDYIRNELMALKLYDFYCNIKKTLDVWFENKDSDEIRASVLVFLYLSGRNLSYIRENKIRKEEQ